MSKPPVYQSGSVTPGHVVAWTTDGVIQDAGTPGNPGLTGIGILSSNASAFSIANAAVTGSYSSLSLGVTATAANLTLQNYNGAAALPFNIVVNGITYPFPGPSGPYLPLAGGIMSGAITLGASGPTITGGSAIPSSTQPSGSIYLRGGAPANARLYVSEGGGVWAGVGDEIFFPVQAYGVVNDPSGVSINANTTAYNACINAATGIGRVVHPAGLSVVLNPLTISVPTDWQMDGFIKLASNSNANFINIASSYVSIYGTGTFDGNKTHQSNPGGIALGGICANCTTVSGNIPQPPNTPATYSNVNINGITIQNVFNWPINLGYLTDSSVTNCTLITSGNSPQFIFSCTNCWFNDNYCNAITDGGFVFYQGNKDCGAIGNTITGCYDGIGVYTDNSTEISNAYIYIIGNLVYSNVGSGIAVTTGGAGAINNSNVLIEGNFLYNNNTGNMQGYGSIACNDSRGVTVQGNWISGDGANQTVNDTYSIYVDTLSMDIVIDGNTISNAGSVTKNGFAIFNAGGSGVAITNNKVFDTNVSPATKCGVGGTAGTKNVLGGNVQLTALAGAFIQYNLSADTTIIGQQNAAGQTRFSSGVEIVSNANNTSINANNPVILSGAGAPSATYPNGSLWLRTDGAANTRLYVSEGGGTWAAIASS